MPKCGSQCYLCDLPIRFDTYQGCSHGCKYCFVQRAGKRDLTDIKPDEGTLSLKSFIEGKRTQETKWADFPIVLHWGGVSDPFQPAEKVHRRSYECLKIFEETQYPFVVSTKGALIGEPEYLELIEKCNCAVQISLVCPSYDKLEPGCPPYKERLEIARRVAATGTRTIIRIQPYMTEVFDEVMKSLEDFAEAGVYGVILEGMKFTQKRGGLEKLGADYVYPKTRLQRDFERIKEKAHSLGMKFYSGENRLRRMGDSLTCCGVADLFPVNTFNLNHIMNKDHAQPTEAQRNLEGSGFCFRCLFQSSDMEIVCKSRTFSQMMIWYYKNRKEYLRKIFGLD